MHISMVPSSTMRYSRALIAGGSAGAADASRSFQAERSSAASSRVSEVKANYDVTNISPREIDQMFEKLVDTGHSIDEDMLMLSSRGEEFLSGIATIAGHIFDPIARNNLVETNRSNMEFARLHGGNLAGYVSFDHFLSTFGSSQDTLLPGHNPGNSYVDSLWAMSTQE